jgi:hypothetical protein
VTLLPRSSIPALALAALVLAVALAAPDPADAQTPARVEVPLSTLPAGARSAIPAWANRSGYIVRVDAGNRLWLYATLDGSDIYVQPRSWQSLRYDPATRLVRIGDPPPAHIGTTETTSPDLPGSDETSIPPGGVILPSYRPIGTYSTNDPGFVPPTRPEPGGVMRPEPFAGDDLADQHEYHEPGQPCPGPGPCPVPQPSPSPRPQPTPGPCPPTPQPSPSIDPTLLLLLIIGGAAVAFVVLLNRRDME